MGQWTKIKYVDGVELMPHVSTRSFQKVEAPMDVIDSIIVVHSDISLEETEIIRKRVEDQFLGRPYADWLGDEEPKTETKQIDTATLAAIKGIMLCCSFPTDYYTDLDNKDKEAVALIVNNMWTDCTSSKRLQVYADVLNIYGENEETEEQLPVPDHIRRFMHVLALRYSPLPADALLEAKQDLDNIKGLTAILLKRHPGSGTVVTPEEMTGLGRRFQITRREDKRGVRFQFEILPEPEEETTDREGFSFLPVLVGTCIAVGWLAVAVPVFCGLAKGLAEWIF